MIAFVAPEKGMVEEILHFSARCSCIPLCAGMLYQLNYHCADAYLLITGYGKVNIAQALSVLLSHYAVNEIIQLGIGGTLYGEKLPVNDAFIASSAFFYDVDYTRIGADEFSQPGMKRAYFRSNQMMNRRLSRVCAEIGIPSHFGLLTTADRFIGTDAEAESLRATRARAVDFLGAVCGQIASSMNVPFSIVQSIVNETGDNAACQYQTNLVQGYHQVQKIAMAYLNRSLFGNEKGYCIDN